MTEFTERQKEIIETAIKLIDEGGIQNVTMKQIAARLGITEPAIYRHFASKADILLSMLEQFQFRSKGHLTKARSANISNLQKVETIFLEHSGQFLERPHMTSVVFSEEAFQDDARLADIIFSVMNAAREGMTEIIAAAQQAQEIRGDIPAEHLALMILGALRLLVKRWRLSKFGFDLHQESQAVWQSLKTLITPPSLPPRN